MADEREVVIRISAKNLSQADFDAARKGIAGLGDDTKKTDEHGKGLGASFSGAMSIIGQGVGIAAGAITAMGAGVLALGQRGATVGDLRDQFDVLNASIGNNADSLTNKLNAAFKHTVTEATFMASTNEALSSGLKLTEGQFELTAQASRVLADRVGGDTAEAYDKLVSAMASGKDSQLKAIGLNVDQAAAVEALATSLGKETSELSESEKAAAVKNAILREMQGVLEESGQAEVDFADRIDQVTTFLANMTDQLGEAIANSPVLAAGMDGVATALAAAFGTDTQGLIDRTVGLIEDAALLVMDLAQVGLVAGDMMTRTFYGVRAVFFALLESIAFTTNQMVDSVAVTLEAAASVPVLGAAYRGNAAEARALADHTQALTLNFRETTGEAMSAAEGNNTVSQTLGTLGRGLAATREAMVKARDAQQEETAATTAATIAKQKATASTDEQTKAQEKLAQKTREFYNWVGERAIQLEEQRQKAAEDSAAKLRAFYNWLGEREIEAAAQKQASLDEQAAALRDFYNFLGERRMEEEKRLADHAKKIKEAFVTNFKQGIEELPNVIIGALQGGGSVIKAAFSHMGAAMGQGLSERFGDVMKKNLGNVLGGAVSATLPVVGALLGPLVDKVWGFFTKAEGRKVNDLRDQFIEAAGGLHELNVKAHDAGLTLDRLLRADKVKEFEAAVNELNGAFDESARDIEIGKAAMEEFGISIEEAGQGFRQSQMNETAEDLLTKIRGLVAVGVDADVIYEKVGDDVGRYIQKSIEMGTTVPREMEPIIRKMIEQGTLIDANGEKFTDLSQIPFADNLNRQFSTLIEKLDQLIDRIGSELPRVIRDVPDEIDIEANIHYVQHPPEDGGVESSASVAGAAARGARSLAAGPASISVGGSSVTLNVALDPQTGRVRQLSDDELPTVQRWLDTGKLRVPARVIAARAR